MAHRRQQLLVYVTWLKGYTYSGSKDMYCSYDMWHGSQEWFQKIRVCTVYCICSRVIGDPFSGSTSMYYVLWLIEYVVAHRKGQAGSLCYIVNSQVNFTLHCPIGSAYRFKLQLQYLMKFAPFCKIIPWGSIDENSLWAKNSLTSFQVREKSSSH